MGLDKDVTVEKQEIKLIGKNKKVKNIGGKIEIGYKYIKSEEIKSVVKIAMDKKCVGNMYPSWEKLFFYTNNNERIIEMDYEEILLFAYNDKKLKMMTGNGKTFIFENFSDPNKFLLLIEELKKHHPKVEKVDEISDSDLAVTSSEAVSPRNQLSKGKQNRKESVQVDYLSNSYLNHNCFFIFLFFIFYFLFFISFFFIIYFNFLFLLFFLFYLFTFYLIYFKYEIVGSEGKLFVKIKEGVG